MEEATRDTQIGRECKLDIKNDSTDTEYEVIQLSADNACRQTTASAPNLFAPLNVKGIASSLSRSTGKITVLVTLLVTQE